MGNRPSENMMILPETGFSSRLDLLIGLTFGQVDNVQPVQSDVINWICEALLKLNPPLSLVGESPTRRQKENVSDENVPLASIERHR